MPCVASRFVIWSATEIAPGNGVTVRTAGPTASRLALNATHDRAQTVNAARERCCRSRQPSAPSASVKA